MAESSDKQLMQRALQLAAGGRGMTYPNPLVGALLVKGRSVIAEGYHKKVGGDHAEIVALKSAHGKATGGTLYVTLEPCCHTGRTGPCTDAIIRAGISRVVVASTDPDPRVNGRGIRQLRQAGIAVTVGIGKAGARRLNQAYFHHQTTGRPFVILKLAQSFDGCIAASGGDSQWISGKESRKYVHQLRSEVGAVAVGGETARRDDPQLTVRLVRGRNPHRLVITGSLNLPASLRLLTENGDRKTIIASTERAIEAHLKRSANANLTYWSIAENSDGSLNMEDLLTKAGTFGVRSLLVEGGSRLATSLMRHRLVDKFIGISAPLLIGDGIRAFGELGSATIADAVTFDETSFRPCGNDIIFEGYPRRKR